MPPQLAMNSTLQPQNDVLSAQPAVLTNQFMSGRMQGQFSNSQLLVQPQTSQQPVLIKSQTLTPSKPLTSRGKSSAGLIGDGTPMGQVGTTPTICKTIKAI